MAVRFITNCLGAGGATITGIREGTHYGYGITFFFRKRKAKVIM